MDWIFAAFLGASVLHMLEEYAFPGGFPALLRRLNPRFAPLVTVRMAVIINGLQLLLCILAIAAGGGALVFRMSVAGLLFVNGLTHLLACLRVGGYAPGVITGTLLYLPLSIFAITWFIRSGQLTAGGAAVSGALGLLYQAVPLGYFLAASSWRRA